MILEYDPSMCVVEYEVEEKDVAKFKFPNRWEGGGFYIGNSGSFIVHAPDCAYAYYIHPDNFETFDHIHEAIREDYTECRWCIGGVRELEYRAKAKAAVIIIGRGTECLICKETRGVQFAHIVPRRHGGRETMPLCPTCHWNYDHNLLKPKEAAAVNNYLSQKKSVRKAG